MSPTYLKLFLAMLGVFSIATSALPADPEIIPGLLQDSSPTSAVILPLPSFPTCADANTEFTCPGGTDTHYVSHDCQDFVIECGTDRTGGDLPDSPQYPGSFLGCVDACASDEGCVALVYTDGPCYLKGELVDTVELPGATGARKATALTSTTAVASATELASATETSFLEVPVPTSSEPELWTTSLSAPITVTTSVVLSVATSSVAVTTVTTTLLGVSSLAG